MEYQLIDSGDGKKLEAFGKVRLIRPCGVALWPPKLHKSEWENVDSSFSREGKLAWTKRLPAAWHAEVKGLKFLLKGTDFGHLGIFPEHSSQWEFIENQIKNRPEEAEKPKVLNLFAYSGAATLAAARAGSEVCHVDAAKGMVDWARENAKLNNMGDRPIRWIVDDVFKFMERELRRGKKYDGIILDPPSFGRGAKKELFKIEDHVIRLLELCKALLNEKNSFCLFTCHTPGFSPTVMENLTRSIFKEGKIESGEMLLPSTQSYTLPMGTFARWSC